MLSVICKDACSTRTRGAQRIEKPTWSTAPGRGISPRLLHATIASRTPMTERLNSRGLLLNEDAAFHPQVKIRFEGVFVQVFRELFHALGHIVDEVVLRRLHAIRAGKATSISD